MNSFPECSVSHCDLQAMSSASGALCHAHYQQKYRGKDPEEYRISPRGRAEIFCAIDGCGRVGKMHSYCKKHHSEVARWAMPAIDGYPVRLLPECAVNECDRPARAYKSGSMCQTHYTQALSGKDIEDMRKIEFMKGGGIECQVTGCKIPAKIKLMCVAHYSRFNQYELSFDEFNQLVQVNECQNPGCSNTAGLRIDHDHNTGAVRDILCNGCNTALGMLGEDRSRIAGLLGYLEIHTH